MSTYTIPNVMAQHPRGERVMDVYSHLLAERVIYLGTGIDAGVANALDRPAAAPRRRQPRSRHPALHQLRGRRPAPRCSPSTTPCSTSGRMSRPPCVGQAIAVGAVMLAAGAAGKRAVLPHARVVLHQPAAQGRGAIPDLILQADEVVRVRGDIEQILARHTGKDAATLRADTDRDRVFTAAAPWRTASRTGCSSGVTSRCRG